MAFLGSFDGFTPIAVSYHTVKFVDDCGHFFYLILGWRFVSFGLGRRRHYQTYITQTECRPSQKRRRRRTKDCYERDHDHLATITKTDRRDSWRSEAKSSYWLTPADCLLQVIHHGDRHHTSIRNNPIRHIF